MCDPLLPDSIIELHHPTPRGFKAAGADLCISALVQALNNGGFQTVASCCGHGKNIGIVSFEKGLGFESILILKTPEEREALFAFLRDHGWVNRYCTPLNTNNSH